MLYTLCIVLILIASILLVLAILVQSPKSGMAANFGASNQVMGVRQTADFLEKFTWGVAVVILVLSLVATTTISSSRSDINASVSSEATELINDLTAPAAEESVPSVEIPAEAAEAQPAEEAPAK
jgi:preprotein translocase subunit SecG